MPGDKLENLYNYLSSSNKIENLPDFNNFKSGLQDSTKARNFFNYLKDNNVVGNLPAEYNFFAIPLGLPTDLPKSGPTDYGQGLLGAAYQRESDMTGVSKRPVVDMVNPPSLIAPAQEPTEFSFENIEYMRIGMDPAKADSVPQAKAIPGLVTPLKDFIKDRVEKKEEELLKMTPEDFDSSAVADRDVITNYYNGQETAARAKFDAEQKANYVAPKPSIQSSKLGTPAPQFVATKDYRTIMAEQNKALNELNAKYQNLTIARKSDIIKPEFGQDPSVTEPKRLREHLFDMGTSVNYALYPEQQQLRKQALETDVLDWEARTGLDVSTGASKGDKMISPVEVGKLLVDGADIELNLTKRALEGSTKTIAQINQEVTRLTNRLSEVNSEFEKDPRLKSIPQNVAIHKQLNTVISELNVKLSEAKNRKEALENYQSSVNALIDREAKPYKELQEQTEKFDRDYIIRTWHPAYGGAGHAINLGKDLLEFGLQTTYGFGQFAQAAKVRLSDAAPEDKGVWGVYSKSYTDDLRYHLGLPSEESYQKRTEFASLDQSGEMHYNWNSLPFQLVKTYVESMAMGKSAATFGRLAEGSAPVRALAASGRLGALGARGLTFSSQLAGMTLGTEVMFGHQLLLQELEKGTDFDTAWNITQARLLIEGASEMLNPLEINLANGRGMRYLEDLTVDQAETAILRASRARDWASSTFGTHKWDDAIDFLYRAGRTTKMAGWNALENSFKEYLEEFMANVANWALDKKLASNNPKYRQDNEMSLQNEYLTAVNTVMGMGLMLGQGAYVKHKGVINTANYLVGTNPRVYLDRLNEDLNKGLVSQGNYELQKAKITRLKEIGDLSKPDLNRIDNSAAGDTDKDNSKFLIFQNNQEIIDKTTELQEAIKSGKTERISSLRGEIIERAEHNGDIVDQIEEIQPVASLTKFAEGLREKRIGKFFTKNASLYKIQAMTNPDELSGKKAMVERAIEKEKERPTPNENLLKRYAETIDAIDARLNFLQSTPTVKAESTEEPVTSATPTGEITVDSIAQKFVTPNAELTDEEMAFAEQNEAAITMKVAELKKEVEGVNEVVTGGVSKLTKGEQRDAYATPQGEVFVQQKYNEEGWDVDVAVPDKTSNTGFRIHAALSQHFDTREEAREWAEKVIEKLETRVAPTKEEVVTEQKKLAREADELYRDPSEKPEDITRENDNIFFLPSLNVQGNIALIGDKLVSAFNATATLMREFSERFVREGGYRQLFPLSNNLLDRYSFIQSKDFFHPGTKVKLVVRRSSYPEFTEEAKDKFREWIAVNALSRDGYMNPADLEDDDFFIPIEILDEDNRSLGFIHTLSYIHQDRVVPTLSDNPDAKDNLEENYKQLKKLRKDIIALSKKGDVNTIITGKTAGHLSTDMEGTRYLPIRERFRNTRILRTLKVNRGTPEIVDGKEVKNNISAGRAILILPTPDDRRVAVGLKRTKITQEVAQSVRYAVELYLGRDVRQREISQIIDVLGREYDLSTIDGLNNYMSLFVYTGTRRRDLTDNLDIRQKYATKPFIDFDRDDETIWFSKQRVFQPETPQFVFKLQPGYSSIDDQLRPIGIARIKLAADFDKARVLDQLESTMMAMNLNIKEDLLSETGAFTAPILHKDGDEITINPTPTFQNTGSNYLDFISNHLSSNILEHEITRPDGKKEFVYFEQSTISLDPNLATHNKEAKKPKAKKSKGRTYAGVKIGYGKGEVIQISKYVRGKKKDAIKSITLNEDLLKEQFENKAWSPELPEGTFATYQEWEDFVVERELFKGEKKEDETPEAFLARKNKEILEQLGITGEEVKIEETPTTKPEGDLGSLLDLTDEDLDIDEDFDTFALPEVRVPITQEDVEEVKKICNT